MIRVRSTILRDTPVAQKAVDDIQETAERVRTLDDDAALAL